MYFTEVFMSELKRDFGAISTGQVTSIYTIGSDKIKAEITDLGATLVSLYVYDKDDKKRDVVLGYDEAAPYETSKGFLGTVVGRSANRTKDAEILIGGKRYLLGKVIGEHNLHSGPDVWSKRLYTVDSVTENEIKLSLLSPDLDQGFPGELEFQVTYRIDGNRLEIEYKGICDKDTLLNPTNHSYFNLNGDANGDVLSHFVRINAKNYTELDADLIPTGRLIEVENTAYDFTERHQIGDFITPGGDDYGKINTYDINFAIDRDDFGLVASAYSSDSGILMNVYTDLPGMQFYIPPNLNRQGKRGAFYGEYSSMCFETQFFPDAIHNPNFKSPILRAEEQFFSKTVYEFETIKV